MSTNPPPTKDIIEAALLCADQPLTLERLADLFDEDNRPAPEELQSASTPSRRSGPDARLS